MQQRHQIVVQFQSHFYLRFLNKLYHCQYSQEIKENLDKRLRYLCESQQNLEQTSSRILRILSQIYIRIQGQLNCLVFFYPTLILKKIKKFLIIIFLYCILTSTEEKCNYCYCYQKQIPTLLQKKDICIFIRRKKYRFDYYNKKWALPILRLLNQIQEEYILISCNIHAGEVQPSFILKGILESLKNYNESANIYLKTMFFFIIPMLNPDVVYCVHYRLDSQGYDQNRIYNRIGKFSRFNGPLAVLKIYKNHNVAFYIDLHSQCAKQLRYLYKLTPQPINSSSYISILLGYLQEFQKQIKTKVHHVRKKEAMLTQINYEQNQYEVEEFIQKKKKIFKKHQKLKFTLQMRIQYLKL